MDFSRDAEDSGSSSGLITGNGLSSKGEDRLDERGVCDCWENTLPIGND